MKKTVIFFLLLSVVTFQYCSSSKKAKKTPAKINYSANVQPIISASCSPCHIPPGGNKKALNSYDAAKTNIDEIIARIQRNPGEKGFMPFKHPKLSDSTIQVFVQWKNDGLPE